MCYDIFAMEKEIPFYLKSELAKIGVAAVYLFGSQALKRGGPLSDYDIAVLFKNSVPAKKYFDLRLKLMALFSDFFKHPEVDVVILDEAPPVLAMNCIDDSRLIFEADHAARISFETAAT